MFIQRDFSLQAYNTLAVESVARHFVSISDVDELREALAWAKSNKLNSCILGGGSNVLLNESIEELVIQPYIMGREVLDETSDSVRLMISAGENWHDLVLWTTQLNWWGLENLALIPGSVGAAPIQNIGAYGREICECIETVRVFDRVNQSELTLTRDQCQFAYRDSIFKSAQKHQFVVLGVELLLSKSPKPELSYPALAQAMQNQDADSPQKIADAVISIRQSKLPDPKLIPNVGSFFKNPIVELAQARKLKKRYPKLVSFELDERHEKLAAGWLIEAAGWKGKHYDGVRVHDKQALVLTNPERRPLSCVLGLAAKIQHSVFEKFQVELEIEPQRLRY